MSIGHEVALLRQMLSSMLFLPPSRLRSTAVTSLKLPDQTTLSIINPRLPISNPRLRHRSPSDRNRRHPVTSLVLPDQTRLPIINPKPQHRCQCVPRLRHRSPSDRNRRHPRLPIINPKPRHRSQSRHSQSGQSTTSQLNWTVCRFVRITASFALK